MKSQFYLVILIFLVAISSSSTETEAKQLENVSYDWKCLDTTREIRLNLSAITSSGKTRESKPYGTIVLSSQLDGDRLIINDNITVAKSFSEQQEIAFERKIVYPNSDLFHPKQIMVDVLSDGKKARIVEYNDGMLTIDDWEGENTHSCDFKEGILAFPTLFYLVPLLKKDIGESYTFNWYLEPFSMFRKSQSDLDFILTCKEVETVDIGEKKYECIRFSLKFDSAKMQTDLWVDRKTNTVVKYRETLPEGSKATILEGLIVN